MAEDHRSVNEKQAALLEAELERGTLRRRGLKRRPYVPKNGPRRGALKLCKGYGWLHLAPKQLPPTMLMLDDIGCSVKALSETIGVGESSIYRWINGQQPMPRTAQLALFWLTSWGQQLINAQAHNDAAMYAGMANSLLQLVEEQRQQLRKLGELADFGSANDPSQYVPVPHRQRSPETTEQVSGFVRAAMSEAA